MKKIQIITLLFFLFCGMSALQAQFTYYNNIAKEDAQKYLTKLYTDMQAFHPDLYQYISKNDYDKAYNVLMQKLDTAEYYDTYNLYKALKAFEILCRDGHSGISMQQFPIKTAQNQNTAPIQSEPPFRAIPFIFNIVKGKMYLNYHCYGNDSIPRKSEIVSIGKETAQEWLQRKRAYISGERDEYRDSQLNTVFYFGDKIIDVDSCEFGYIPYGSRDTLYKILDCCIPKQEFINCYLQYFDEPGAFRGDNIKEHLTFRAVDNGRIGIIFMRLFWPVKKMLPLINKALDSLKFYGAEDLIIDLRQSPGGYGESGDALIDRITNKPYRTQYEEHCYLKHAMLTSNNKAARNMWARRKYLKKSEIKPIMEAGRDTVITYQYPEIKPKNYKNKFTGRIWVLTGANTFSAAVGVAAIVQDCKLGTVVGEETGGIPNTYGNLLFYPLTGVIDEKIIKFTYIAPFVKYIRPSGDDTMKLRGVIPDIEIEPNIIIDEDTQLQTLIEIIREKRLAY